MHHVVALIAERQKGNALIGLCPDCRVLCVLFPRLDAKLLSSWGSHWKQSLYFYGVEARLSTSYPPQTLPLLCCWWDLLSMMMRYADNNI
ncbi:hypothetical protein HanIR_Chr15g0773681 [Helianthus annuus]|nr:hypothetical protein HanIR_Chr15g0773681 [Helianthus annuus]